MTWTKDEYSITTNKQLIDLDYVHSFLQQSYWAKDIPRQVVERSIEGSLCFAVLHRARQVGFARVITDQATFAYLADVFIDPQYRGRGLSKWLMASILEHPKLQGLRRFMLATRDAHGLYRQFGFTPLPQPENIMLRHRPNVYTTEKIL